MSLSKNGHFLDHLQHVVGGPWTLFEAQRELDKLVLQPLPLSIDSPWADPALFLDFLTCISHRRLIQCFIGAQVIREWTFEWIVQMLLEREYHAHVRRHVIVGEIASLGEIDVLAFLPNGHSLLVECKSSSKGLTDRQLDRFVSKGLAFPTDRALLLIDTDDPHQMQQRMGQFGQAMQRAFGSASIGTIQTNGGSSIVNLRKQLFVADTAGGILSTLQAILHGIDTHA